MKPAKRISDARGLEVFDLALAYFLKWQRSQSVQDEREHGEQSRAEIQRVGKAVGELRQALRPFAGGDLARPVGSPDGALIGAGTVWPEVLFEDHLQRLRDLRAALARVAYMQRAAEEVGRRRRQRGNGAVLAWVHCAADHWQQWFKVKPSHSGTFGRLLGEFQERCKSRGGPSPPRVGEEALDRALAIWHEHNAS